MPVMHPPDSKMGKELARWDRPRGTFELDHENKPIPGTEGMNRRGYEHYPLMLYKAVKNSNGKAVCMGDPPTPWLYAKTDDYNRACLEADAITRACQRVVGNEDEERNAKRQGWRESPQEAIAYQQGLDEDVANAAAEAQWGAQRMSSKARAEIERAEEAAGPDHAPDVPADAKRGWTPQRRAAHEAAKAAKAAGA